MAYKPNRKRKRPRPADPRRYVVTLKFPEWLPKRTDGLCRCGCGAKMKTARQVWATDACRDAKLEEFWILKGNNKVTRDAVFRRDRGVCCQCGMDTETERLKCRGWGYRPLAGDEENERVRKEREEIRHKWMLKGFPCPSETWWQADHIKPLVEGGTNTLDNYRTLCVVCHKGETAKLAARRAQAGRAKAFGLTAYLFPDMSAANG